MALHPDAAESVRQLLNSDAWEKFLKPALELLKVDFQNELMDPSRSRKDEHPDDFIRGCMATLDVVLHMPEAALAESDAQAEGKERERRELRDWEIRAASGRIGPFTPEPPSPTDE